MGNSKEVELITKYFLKPEEATELKEELVNVSVGLIVEGRSKGEIMEFILDQSVLIKNKPDALNLIQQAIGRLEEMTKQDAASVVASHTEAYEMIFAWFKSIRNTSGANKALKAKERLAGIFKENKLTVNQKINTVIEREVVYDYSRLTASELKDFNFLTDKGTMK